MVEAFEQVEKSYGMDMVYLFRENAELLGAGEECF